MHLNSKGGVWEACNWPHAVSSSLGNIEDCTKYGVRLHQEYLIYLLQSLSDIINSLQMSEPFRRNEAT